MIKLAVHSDQARLIRLLTLALVLALVTIGWLGWTTFQAYRFVTWRLPAIIRMEELQGHILLFDEILTMSARMAAATDDSQWEARYRRFDPQLDVALKEVTRLAPEVATREAAGQTDTANARLVMMENRAFDLVRQGRRTEAQELLDSTEYEAQKKIYSAGMTELSGLLNQIIESVRAQRQAQVLWGAIATAVLTPSLVLGWWFVLGAARRWQTALEESNQQLSQQTAELKEFTERLDEKVAERTKQLQESALASLNMMEDAVHNRGKTEQALEDLRRVVTERERAESQTLRSQKQFHDLFEFAPDAIVMANEAGLITRVNRQAEQLFGYQRSDLIGQPAELLIPEYACHGSVAQREPDLAVAEPRPTGAGRSNLKGRRKDASVFFADISLSPLESEEGRLIVTAVRDATERHHAAALVEQSLREKEVLLKEIHHRVKNNLQVISSLLALQTDTVADAGTRVLLIESQNRVRAMAMIHEKLYQSPTLAHVDFGEYVNNLTGFLFHSYSNAAGRVALRVAADEVHLNIDTAVPCGLILNELISNALKHAFKDARQGELRVELRAVPDGYSLTVADNGVGLPANFDLKQTQSLGLQLVDTLCNQLMARLAVQSPPGTQFQLFFKDIVGSSR